jgi:hypothetical protein
MGSGGDALIVDSLAGSGTDTNPDHHQPYNRRTADFESGVTLILVCVRTAAETIAFFSPIRRAVTGDAHGNASQEVKGGWLYDNPRQLLTAEVAVYTGCNK